MRLIRQLGLGLAVLAMTAGTAMAFHDGGVAYCAGCHTMHNSQDGAPVDTVNVGGNAYLLNNGNSSDTCLRCHAAYGQFAGGEGYGAGGDFYWLTKTYSWSAHGHTSTSEGESHGHNVLSPAYGLVEDETLDTAPGGDFSSTLLTCTSCHDPHGNQNFRILYGDALGPIYGGGRYEFENDAPLAVGNSRRTVSGTGRETNENHTVYKSGMSAWCSNCHGDFHTATAPGIVHPTGIPMGSTVAGVYNGYVSSDSLNVPGQSDVSYWGLVPFEDVDADLSVEDLSIGYTAGPVTNDRVMCLSCHRAHASAYPDAGRWDFHATFVAHDSHPQDGDGGLGVDDVVNADYEYEFVSNQRSLCNKCHMKDEFDAPFEE